MSAVEIVPGSSNPAGHVILEGPTIEALVRFTDPEIAEILRQTPESHRVKFVVRGLRSGVIAMGNDMTSRLREATRFMQSTLDAQVVSFGEHMSAKVRDQLGDADKDGHVQRRLKEILTGTSAELKAALEKALPEAFDKQTKRSVDVIQVEGERAMRQIAALFAEEGVARNVIQEARRDFAQRLEEVKIAMTVAQTKAANPTPREAGLDYEAAVHGQLSAIGSLRGDDVESTANKVGKVPHCKKGDTRIVVAADGNDVSTDPCIAVEIRDRESNEFTLDDVEVMLRNREAQVAMVIAAHPGSLPKQYADRPFAISRPKRTVTLVLDLTSPDAEVLLATAYQLACILAVEAVRQSRAGNWDAVARKAEVIEQVVEGMVEEQAAFDHIEKKARDAGLKASKRHKQLVGLIVETVALFGRN